MSVIAHSILLPTPGQTRLSLNVRDAWPDAPARIGRMSGLSVAALLAVRALLPRLPESLDRKRVGVFFGTEFGCVETNELYHRTMVERGYADASPMRFAQTIPSVAVGEVSIAFGFLGPTTTVMRGRHSGMLAVQEARIALARNRCTHALVLAGDVLGEATLQTLAQRGRQVRGEAMVALLINATDLPSFDQAVRVDAGADWLGASTLIDVLEASHKT